MCDSLASNLICYKGKVEGLNALAAAIKELPNLSSLECASSSGDQERSAIGRGAVSLHVVEMYG